MNELTNSENVGGISIVENLSQQARYYARQTSFNMLQLGRVLTEAKPLIPHGKWLEWVEENTGMNERNAQYFMKCYETYGLDPQMAELGQSKLKDMLALSEAQRTKLLAEKNVAEMTSRELKEEVRKAREEEQEKAREAVAAEKVNAAKMADSAARKARAESAEELEALRAKIAEQESITAELKKRAEEAEENAKAATQAAIEAGKDVSARSAELDKEAARLRRELADRDAALHEMQNQYEEVNQKWLDELSARQRGDAERSDTDILNAEAVSDAVRMFIGQVGRIPYMHGTFATMDNRQREEYREIILQVKDWAEKSLEALETIDGIGGVVE